MCCCMLAIRRPIKDFAGKFDANAGQVPISGRKVDVPAYRNKAHDFKLESQMSELLMSMYPTQIVVQDPKDYSVWG